jgi:hypothetical protein
MVFELFVSIYKTIFNSKTLGRITKKIKKNSKLFDAKKTCPPRRTGLS